MIKLGVNIDHVATVRQARRTYEPDPLRAAHEAVAGGADSITMHLREDRRHIQDADVDRVREAIDLRVNLEMAVTGEMIAIAKRVQPGTSMFVPEGRMEVTTEGGLDVAGRFDVVADGVKQLKDAGIAVSAFIDAEDEQIDAAARAGFDICEIHTGPFAHVHHDGGDWQAELAKVAAAGQRIQQAGMKFNAGHALNYDNVQHIAALPGCHELHIGHSIISRSVFTGIRAAVAEMKRLMVEAETGASPTT